MQLDWEQILLILFSEENSDIAASKFGKKMNKKVENVEITERRKPWNIIA